MSKKELEQLKELEMKLAYHNIGLARTKFSWVGMPINIATTLGEIFFSWSVGAVWLMYLIEKLNLKKIHIKVPIISYRVDGFRAQAVPGYGAIYRPPLYSSKECEYDRLGCVSYSVCFSGFYIDKDTYNINWLNFIPGALNYIFRNIGKLIGAILVSPFTIPAYGIIKIYSFAKKQLLKARLKSAYRNFDKQELVQYFLGSRLKITGLSDKIFDWYLRNAVKSIKSYPGSRLNPGQLVGIENLARFISLADFTKIYSELHDNPSQLRELIGKKPFIVDLLNDELNDEDIRELLLELKKAFYQAKLKVQTQTGIKEIFAREVKYADVMRKEPSPLNKSGELRKVRFLGSYLLMTQKQAQKFDIKSNLNQANEFLESENYEEAIKHFKVTISFGGSDRVVTILREMMDEHFISDEPWSENNGKLFGECLNEIDLSADYSWKNQKFIAEMFRTHDQGLEPINRQLVVKHHLQKAISKAPKGEHERLIGDIGSIHDHFAALFNQGMQENPQNTLDMVMESTTTLSH